MGRLKALIVKEFRQIRRTRAYFALIFIAPFAQLLIMGSAITIEVKNVPMVIVDMDHTPSSREIIRKFDAIELFQLKGLADSPDQARNLLDDGVVKTAVVIPHGFEADVQTGRKPELQLLIDGVDGNSAGISLGYTLAVLRRVQQGWMEAQSINSAGVGSGSAAAGNAADPGSMVVPQDVAGLSAAGGGIELVPRMFYNPALESKLNFIPGLIGILLVMITTMMPAINIVREKELGTLEQLMVTPLGGTQLILGKIVPFTILGMLQFTMGIIAARLVFGIPIVGSIPLLYGMVALFLMSTLGMGIFISTVTGTQQQAMFVAWFTLIFTLLLSGFFVPIQNMPDAIQLLTYINPLRYFIAVIREIYLKATPFRYLWTEAAAMAGIGIVLISGAVLRFHKRLK